MAGKREREAAVLLLSGHLIVGLQLVASMTPTRCPLNVGSRHHIREPHLNLLQKCSSIYLGSQEFHKCSLLQYVYPMYSLRKQLFIQQLPPQRY